MSSLLMIIPNLDSDDDRTLVRCTYSLSLSLSHPLLHPAPASRTTMRFIKIHDFVFHSSRYRQLEIPQPTCFLFPIPNVTSRDELTRRFEVAIALSLDKSVEPRSLLFGLGQSNILFPRRGAAYVLLDRGTRCGTLVGVVDSGDIP